MADAVGKPNVRPAQEWHEAVSEIITANAERLAHQIIAEHFRRNPNLADRYGERERELYIRDTIYNLEALTAAIKLLTPEMFADYVSWLKEMLETRGIPTAGLPLHFECLREALRELLPDEAWPLTNDYLQTGIEGLTRT